VRQAQTTYIHDEFAAKVNQQSLDKTARMPGIAAA
jgi:hypothetical protein